MRRCYLVCYDVHDPKRLRKVFRVLKGYGEHWQFSVFFCVLKDIDRVRLQYDLEEKMNLREDQAMILDLGPNERKARESAAVVGVPLPEAENSMLVI